MMLSHIVMPTILLAAFIIAFVACDSAPPTPAPVSTPTLTPTPASVPTPTPTPAFTPTLTPTPASVPTSIPTSASTPTPASVPTPTPTLTPNPTSVPMPTPTPTPGPSYLTEEIPPCTPVPGSSVDPCEPGAEGTLITESKGLILIEPALLVEDLMSGLGTKLYVTHIVLRGTYLPGTVRCTSGHRNRYPSYVGDDWDVLFIYCFADVRVNSYLLGAGPPTLTVIVASILYGREGADDDDYGVEQLETRRSIYESVLVDGGRLKSDRPLRRGIGGKEVVLFIGPSTSLSVEAWRVFRTWDVERREDDSVVALHPNRRWFNREEQSYAEMELPALRQAVTTAHQERVAAHGGRTTADPNFPMFVTDANRLRQFFSDPKVGGYDPGAPTPAPPPPPCGLAVPDQTDNLGLMRDCMTLLAAKDTLRGAGDLDWSVETTVGDWEGITTGDTLSRVTKLLLPSKSLTGSIPPGLGDLSGLAHLDLSSNSLTGEIPAELGWLSNLESLLLSGNQLTGCIPSALEDVLANDLDTLGLPYCTPEG